MSKTEIRFKGIFTSEEIKAIYNFVDREDFSVEAIEMFTRNRSFMIIKKENYVEVLKQK